MGFGPVPVTMINAVDTATQTGAPVYCGQIYGATFTSQFGDVTAAGTIKLQGSNQPATKGNWLQFVPDEASWNDITGASSTIASGVGPAIVLSNVQFLYLRAVYTRSSGGSTTVQVYGDLFST